MLQPLLLFIPFKFRKLCNYFDIAENLVFHPQELDTFVERGRRKDFIRLNASNISNEQ